MCLSNLLMGSGNMFILNTPSVLIVQMIITVLNTEYHINLFKHPGDVAFYERGSSG